MGQAGLKRAGELCRKQVSIAGTRSEATVSDFKPAVPDAANIVSDQQCNTSWAACHPQFLGVFKGGLALWWRIWGVCWVFYALFIGPFMAWRGLVDGAVLRFGPGSGPNQLASTAINSRFMGPFRLFPGSLMGNVIVYWLFHRGTFQPGTSTNCAYGLTDASLIGRLSFGNEVGYLF